MNDQLLSDCSFVYLDNDACCSYLSNLDLTDLIIDYFESRKKYRTELTGIDEPDGIGVWIAFLL